MEVKVSNEKTCLFTGLLCQYRFLLSTTSTNALANTPHNTDPIGRFSEYMNSDTIVSLNLK